MDPMSMMMMGSTALSGLGSYFGGQSAAKTARAAAERQAQNQYAAIRGLDEAGSQYMGRMEKLGGQYDPYIEQGGAATNRLMALLGLGGDGASPTDVYRATPGYEFLQGEGIQALDRSAAARGMLNSGRQSKDLLRFGQGLADTTANNYMGQLQPLMNRGFAGTQGKVNTMGQGYQGNLGAHMTAFGGLMDAAKTVPQGMVAGANAENAGMTGALGAMNYGMGQMGSRNTLQQLLGQTSRGSSYAPMSMSAGGMGAIY